MQGIGHMDNGRAEKSSKDSPEINAIRELLSPRRRGRGMFLVLLGLRSSSGS